jgi:steroid delta-isomerase-like uncharacterized protein
MQAKDITLDFINRLNSGDVAGAAALLAEDSVNHAAVPEAQGRAGFLRIVGKVREAFPDLTYKIEDTIADGDRCFVRLTMSGTHKGPFNMNKLSVPPSGKRVSWERMDLLRVSNGRIVEHWMNHDVLAMARQLGLEIKQA